MVFTIVTVQFTSYPAPVVGKAEGAEIDAASHWLTAGAMSCALATPLRERAPHVNIETTAKSSTPARAALLFNDNTRRIGVRGVGAAIVEREAILRMENLERLIFASLHAQLDLP